MMKILLGLLGLAALSACSITCPDGRGLEATDKNRLEVSALYAGPGVNKLPLDAWTQNPRLERFLRETATRDGVAALAGYGMHCTPRLQDSTCTDCFSCTKSFRDYRLGMASGLPIYVEWYRCEDNGEILVQAEIGPGSRIVAMTYWKTTPQARQSYARRDGS